MQKVFYLLILFSLSVFGYATGQFSEKLIMNGDTLDILCEPLESYLKQNEPRYDISPYLGQTCHTALWRGYIGYWEIKDNKLFLINVFACGDTSKSIKSKLFPSISGLILADWFSGELFIPSGELLYDMHLGHEKHYEKETVIIIEKGLIKGRKEYINGVEKDETRLSRERQSIIIEIYKRIDWTKIEKFSKHEYEVKLNIDTIGNLGFVNIGRVKKVKGIYELRELSVEEKIYEECIREIVNSFPLIKRYYFRETSLESEDIFIIEFSKKKMNEYVH